MKNCRPSVLRPSGTKYYIGAKKIRRAEQLQRRNANRYDTENRKGNFESSIRVELVFFHERLLVTGFSPLARTLRQALYARDALSPERL